MACTSPRRTRSPMSRLATTPGNRLVMPRSSTANGSSLVLIAPLYSIPDVNGGRGRSKKLRPQPPAEQPETSGSGGHLDLAADDLLLVAVDLTLDVVDEAT